MLNAAQAIATAANTAINPPPRPVLQTFQGTLNAGDQVEYDVDVEDARFPVTGTLIFADNPPADRLYDIQIIQPDGTPIAGITGTKREALTGIWPLSHQIGIYRFILTMETGQGSFTFDVWFGDGTVTGASDQSPL